MRTFLFALVFAIGCASGPVQPGGVGYDDMGCKLTCDKCPMQALCVGAPYVPACLQQCQTTDECDSGVCAIIGTTTAAPRVCFGSLMLCEPTTCANPAQCADAMTQLKPLAASGGVCGWQVVHCINGCDSATGSCK
jgi:hypothetical protein